MSWTRHGAAASAPKDHATAPAGLIALRGIERSYEAGVSRAYVLRNITLDIAPGEFVSVMGPSGAGKSTLLNVLGMFDSAWTGQYWLAGDAMHALSPKARVAVGKKHIGFVFQQYHLLDDLTVAENLEVPLAYRDVPASQRQARVADTLDRFGIVGKKDLFPRQLSGGQQQLVGIARAIIAEPAVILADEPTGNLHSAHAREIIDLFVSLNARGTTIVQVTHSDEHAARGTRIITLRDGWIV
jgi:putative ABC transport system ATP-binding protein